MKYLLAMALLVSTHRVCVAQSHDLNSPAPLGPGVNKGNVDNMGNGPHYYYFVGGPGHFDLHYAFHEMGLLGNPFRQTLYFDVIDEKSKVIAHDGIQSMGSLQRFTHPGLTDHPRRFVIRVVTQPGLIRLGGYYEIEITGAAFFDGKTSGEIAAPQQSEPLIHPSSPLVQSSGPLVQSSGPLVQPAGPLLQPLGALTNVQQTLRELRLTLAADILFDSGQSTIRPDASNALDRVAQIIHENGTGVATIEGLTDAKGRADYNLNLSNARAQAVQRWLMERAGFAPSAFSVRGLGATRFVAPNTKPDGKDDPEGRQKNRRVEIVVQRKG